MINDYIKNLIGNIKSISGVDIYAEDGRHPLNNVKSISINEHGIVEIVSENPINVFEFSINDISSTNINMNSEGSTIVHFDIGAQELNIFCTL